VRSRNQFLECSIAGCTALRWLHLGWLMASRLEPLASLTQLRALMLRQSAAKDLEPLRELWQLTLLVGGVADAVHDGSRRAVVNMSLADPSQAAQD
jgi:hypothetical protein